METREYGLQYRYLLQQLYWQKPETYAVFNERTEEWIRAYRQPKVLTVDCRPGIPFPRWRRLPPYLPLADTIWQLMGTADASWINRVAPQLWESYCEIGEDGIPWLQSAYGVRWKQQIPRALVHIRDAPASRQVYVTTWESMYDTLTYDVTPMPPCIVGFHLSTDQDSKLSITFVMRSSDLVIGLPHDVSNAAWLLTLLARELNLPRGYVHMVLLNAHMYDSSHLTVETILNRAWPIDYWIDPPNWTRKTVVAEPDRCVTEIRERYAGLVREIPTTPKPLLAGSGKNE